MEQASLFVKDEASAIDWLRQLLKAKPQTFADINPQFMQQLGGWNKNEAQLDLRELLNQNFLCYDGKGPVPEQIHAYLSTNWKELRNLPKDDLTLVGKAKDRWYVPDPRKAATWRSCARRHYSGSFRNIKRPKRNSRYFVWRLSALASRKPGRNTTTPLSLPWPTKSPTTSWKKIPSCSCGTTRQ